MEYELGQTRPGEYTPPPKMGHVKETPFSGDGQQDGASWTVFVLHSWPCSATLGSTVRATPQSAGIEKVVVSGPKAGRERVEEDAVVGVAVGVVMAVIDSEWVAPKALAVGSCSV